MKTDVCHVLTDSNVGGAGIFIRNLVASSDRNFFSHRVLLPRGATLPAELLREAGAEVIFGDFEGERSLSPALIRASAAMLRERAPDILHTHGACGAALAALIPHGKRTPVLSTLHCALPRRAARLAGNFPPRFWAATSGEAGRLLYGRGVSATKLRVILNGSPRLAPPTEAERVAARRALGLAEGDFAVGISARLEAIKGHETLLRAAARLADRGKNVTLVLIGDGSQRGALVALSERLGISERVIFTGFQKEVRAVYCALDAHVNCSLGSETSCLALSETMSMAIPQMVSDCAGNLELSRGGRAALVFPRGDFTSLADRISILSDSPAARKKYSEKAEAEFHARLTVDRMARAYEKYYLDILSLGF